MLVPEGVLSHHTALEFWGGSGPVDDQLHVSVRRDPKAALPRVHGLRVHEVQELEVTGSARLPLTSPARTFIDLASCCGLSDLVTAGDSPPKPPNHPRKPMSPHSLVDRRYHQRMSCRSFVDRSRRQSLSRP